MTLSSEDARYTCIRFRGDAQRELLNQVGRVRVSAWAAEGVEIGDGDGLWLDSHDADGFHWAVHHPETRELVAAARMTVHELGGAIPDADHFGPLIHEIPAPVALITRLVVLPGHRGRGLASQLDGLRIEHAASCSAAMLLAQASGTRVAALRALGFEPLGIRRGPPCQ